MGNALVRSKPMLSFPWIIFHVALGFSVAQSSLLAKTWCVAILVIGIYQIIRNKNKHEEAALWSIYIAAADVPLRACEGALLWEIGKLGGVILLILGMMFPEEKKGQIPFAATVMLALLLPGVVFTFSWSNNIREDLTFNISGMVCLIISMIYFYKRSIGYTTFRKMLSYSLLPIIVLCIVLYYRTPSLETIEFRTSANFATSGGFGPNQVATILGYGWLIVLLLLYLREKVTFNKFLTYGLLVFLIYRSIFTFSRGGNLAAILAFAVFLLFYSFSRQNRGHASKNILTLVLVVVLGIGVFQTLDSITGGIIGYRFTGRDSNGEKIEDVTSGRTNILELEYELFKDHPLGVGVGGSRQFRHVVFNDFHASHNEFGRLLSEHGVFGIGVILLMLLSPLLFSRKLPNGLNKAFSLMFFVLCIVSMMHSGCRTALPEFIYGLSFIYLIPCDDEKTPLHRQ